MAGSTRLERPLPTVQTATTLGAAAAAIAGGCGALLASHLWVARASRGRLADRVEEVPATETGLLLGTAENRRDGGENRFFTYRIETAAALWHAGKVRHLLLSGSSGEPEAMARRLQALGVPSGVLTLDPGGTRTLASLRRTREVFGLRQVVIISQRFHNQRALFLADACGLQATACNARGLPPRAAWKTLLREAFARLRAVAEVALQCLRGL